MSGASQRIESVAEAGLAPGGGPLVRRRRTLAAAALWVLAGGFVLARLVGPPSTPGRLGSWYDVLTVPFFVAAGVAGLVAAAGRAGRAARGWRAVATAWLLSAMGYGAILLAPAGEPRWLGLVGSVLYDAYYPLMVAGLLLLSVRPVGGERRLRALLDVALVAGATQLLIWWFTLRTAGPGVLADVGNDVLLTAVGELAVLISAAWLLSGVAREPEGALRLLGAGAVVATLADLAAVQFHLGNAPRAGHFADAALVVSATLVASAGLVRPGGASDRRRLSLDLLGATLGHVPTLAVLAVLTLLVGEAWQAGGAWPVMVLGTAAITAAALLALSLARRGLEREAEERARQAERLAVAQRLATVGHLAGAVAHDFNNLAIAMGEIAAELREGPPPAATAGELEALSRKAGALCRRLLDMARGAGEPCPAPHELGAALAALEPLVRRLVPARIRLEVAAGAPAWALVDLAQLELAVVNLVVNARDAIAGEGTIAVAAREEVVAAGHPLAARGVAPGRWTVVSVSDSGAGMDAATLAHAAEPFFTTKPPGQGTGLGLSLVSDMAAAAGGRVLVESSPGRGTTVRLVLAAGPLGG